MTFEVFLTLFVILSAVCGLVTEALKKIIFDKKNLPSNLAALVCAFVVGVVGVILYLYLSGAVITTNTIIFAVLMGISVAIGSMVGYDKVIQTIKQFKGGRNNVDYTAEGTQTKSSEDTDSGEEG